MVSMLYPIKSPKGAWAPNHACSNSQMASVLYPIKSQKGARHPITGTVTLKWLPVLSNQIAVSELGSHFGVRYESDSVTTVTNI